MIQVVRGYRIPQLGIFSIEIKHYLWNALFIHLVPFVFNVKPLRSLKRQQSGLQVMCCSYFVCCYTYTYTFFDNTGAFKSRDYLSQHVW